jgi:hypothetical protein
LYGLAHFFRASVHDLFKILCLNSTDRDAFPKGLKQSKFSIEEPLSNLCLFCTSIPGGLTERAGMNNTATLAVRGTQIDHFIHRRAER